MFRTLCVLSAAGGGLALVALNGRIGSVDLTQLPPALMAFIAISAVVLIGLRLI